MKTVKEILQLNDEHYEFMRFQNYSNWCENVAGKDNPKMWQLLLANAAINKWFNLEYAKCEAEFIKTVSRYEESDTITLHDLSRCHADTIIKLFDLRPAALLDDLKKIPPAPSIRVSGQKVKVSTFNLN